MLCYVHHLLLQKEIKINDRLDFSHSLRSDPSGPVPRVRSLVGQFPK